LGRKLLAAILSEAQRLVLAPCFEVAATCNVYQLLVIIASIPAAHSELRVTPGVDLMCTPSPLIIGDMVFNSKHKPVAELFGLPEPPKTGRARLVHVAIELFYSHGFQAVGVDQIIASTEVTKKTFYKHFDSKDDLLVGYSAA
jgi:hypothetical protein